MANTFSITKASGERVPFSREQLRHSLERSGASTETISNVIAEVEKDLYEGIPTNKIYKKAFSLLKKVSRPFAAKYKLKEAIMELGPTGYPFERFIAEVLKHQGFKVEVDVVVKGRCVNHEIDIIAEKEDAHYLVECKYHNATGIICDVKIPLYIQARFKDVEKEWSSLPGHEGKKHVGWVITNTRFSEDAIKYGLCVGLHLMSWDYPKKGGLREQIDSAGLYPITCINGLSKIEKQRLLDSKVILCSELVNNTIILQSLNISQSRQQLILQEVDHILKRSS